MAVAILAMPVTLWAADTVDLPNGAKLDLTQNCPVCNMKVGSGALGYAAAVFKDGKIVGFDGPGDMFRYFLDPGKYKFDPAQITNLYVSEYGSPKLIDAKTAFYVVGSDFTGMMGPDAAPFATKEAAEKFKTDHKGRAVVPFAEVKLSDLASKKKMMKMDHGH
jgi:nitrous oxide reductase accessory protein NosL